MLTISALTASDILDMVKAFAAIGWNKPASQFERYLSEQSAGERAVVVARLGAAFAGYVTVLWRSPYPSFVEGGIPEIADLNVLTAARRQKVGTALMDEAESLVAKRAPKVGLAVGLDPDYGAAQKLYGERGYVPDGRGATSHGNALRHGQNVSVDDDLVLHLTKLLRGAK